MACLLLLRRLAASLCELQRSSFLHQSSPRRMNHAKGYCWTMPKHQTVGFSAFLLMLLLFCATGNVNVLRLIPCIIVGEVGRILVLWVSFLCNKKEAAFLRDWYFIIMGRLQTEAYKTAHGSGRKRRRVEAQFLGSIYKYHGLVQSYAENYLGNIAAEAKIRREASSRDFLNVLGKGSDDEPTKRSQFTRSRSHRQQLPRMISLSHLRKTKSESSLMRR